MAQLVPWQNLATKQDIDELRKATRQDIDELKRAVDELRKSIDQMSLRLDALEKTVSQISLRVDALGARWGVLSEDAFREGVRELLRAAGYAVEKWLYYDADGYVYGYPSEVELDVVIKDGAVIAVEVTSSLKRGDLFTVKQKTELYTKTTGRPVNAVLVITPYISDRNPSYIKAMAERINIKLIAPEEAAARPV